MQKSKVVESAAEVWKAQLLYKRINAKVSIWEEKN